MYIKLLHFDALTVVNDTSEEYIAGVANTERNFSSASMTPVSEAFSVLACFTNVNDTAEEFLFGVSDNGKPSFSGVDDTT
jgi:hypothetical protein